jgi:hypothetical protein
MGKWVNLIKAGGSKAVFHLLNYQITHLPIPFRFPQLLTDCSLPAAALRYILKTSPRP